MTPDPIVEEVRTVRDAFAKEHDYDVARIFDALRAMAAESGGPRVTLPPRRPNVRAVQPTAAADDTGTYRPGLGAERCALD
jgi:hypothetical protein